MKSLLSLFIFVFLSSFLPETTMAECKIWVNGYTKKNGTVVKGHYRTCPDGDKNNNYGKPEYKGQPARERDQDGDGLPNYRDRDDNNNGLSDNTDHALDKIYRENDLRRVIIPSTRNLPRYEDFPIVTNDIGITIIFSRRTIIRSTTFKWDSYGNCSEYAPNGARIRFGVDANICREEIGSYVKWDSYGNCSEYAPNGARITFGIDANICRAYVGRYFKWDSYGNCSEYAPNGARITFGVDANICRQYGGGSRYEWDSYGNCNEYASNGARIRFGVNTDYCRYPGSFGSIDLNPAVNQSRSTKRESGQLIDLLGQAAADAILGVQ